MKPKIRNPQIWLTFLLTTAKNSTTIESRVDLTLGHRNQETSVINSTFVNANLQAILNYAQKVAMRSFIQATLNACHRQNNLVNTFISGLLGNRPHLVARKLLQKQYLGLQIANKLQGLHFLL